MMKLGYLLATVMTAVALSTVMLMITSNPASYLLKVLVHRMICLKRLMMTQMIHTMPTETTQ